jgi:hypothetical protein
MRRRAWVILALLALCATLAGALAAYFLLNRQAEPPVAEAVIPPPRVQPAPVPPPAPAEPVIAHPLAEAPAQTPLPELEQSDAVIIKALRAVLGKNWKDLLLPDALIRNIVATVDALPRQYLPARVVPIKRIAGAFITSGEGDDLAIGATNRDRYSATVRLIEAVDSAKLIAVYREFYPLFQRAYVQLGYPKAYFNDRLIEAIDDLLAAPAPAEPIRLVQPKVLYRYADEQLEALSAGQKIMIRVGSDNAGRLQSKLREIRKNLVQDPSATTSR